MSAHTSSLYGLSGLFPNQRIQVNCMSFIPCTQNCKFHNEGLCMLAQAQAVNQAIPNDVCLNFTPKLSNEHSDGLTNIAHPDQV